MTTNTGSPTPTACYRPHTEELYDAPLSVATQCGVREALRVRVLTTIEHTEGFVPRFTAFAYDGGVYVGDGARWSFARRNPG